CANLTDELILHRVAGDPDGIFDRPGVGPSVRHDRHPVDAEQGRASELAPVEASTQLADAWPDEKPAKLAPRRLRDLVTQAAKQEIRRRLGHLDGHVPDEAVSDDHIGAGGEDVLGLDVADEPAQLSFEAP